MNKILNLIQGPTPSDSFDIRVERAKRNERRPLPQDLMSRVFEFLIANDPLVVGKDFLVVDLVNHFWKGSADSIWQERAFKNRISLIPRAISYKKYMHDLYAFGSRAAWQKAFHIDIGPVPNIPDDLLAKRLEPDPWDKTKTIGETSEAVYIPKNMTLRLMGLLFAKRFPLTASGYDDRRYTRNILDRHGDAPVVTPGWRLLRKEGVELHRMDLNFSSVNYSQSYASQKKAVDKHKDWIIVPLIERVCLNMLMYLNHSLYGSDFIESSSGLLCPAKVRLSRTSTLILERSGRAWPTFVYWENLVPLLSFGIMFNEESILPEFFCNLLSSYYIGVAVGIHPKSS